MYLFSSEMLVIFVQPLLHTVAINVLIFKQMSQGAVQTNGVPVS